MSVTPLLTRAPKVLSLVLLSLKVERMSNNSMVPNFLLLLCGIYRVILRKGEPLMTLDLQKNSVKSNIEILFIYFILLQPVLDVLAYFNIPISTVIRGLAMGVGFVYIILQPANRKKKLALTYLITLGLFMVVHFVINYMVKSPFIISLEVTYIIKTVFFIEILIVYVFVMRSFSANANWQKTVQQFVFINMAGIAVVMLVASLTDTAKRSYGSLAKEGHSGWFFSGNELSVILGMGFSIMILYMVNKKTLINKVKLLPVIALVIWAMLSVGTKVSFGSILIVLGISILVFIMKAIQSKKDWSTVVILSSILAATIFITPSTPIENNLNLTFGVDFQEINPSDVGNNHEESGQIQQKLLSGRKQFLTNTIEQYKAAPMSQKIFGMGIGGNDTDSPKLIEMDFLDWYFNFGLLGFALLLAPLIYIGYHIVINLFNYHLKKINVPLLLVGVSVSLGLGTALVAGHVLSSPASSIYLAIFISYLVVLTKQPRSSYIKK